MKVHIITNGVFPDGPASTNRIRCYVKALLNHSNEVEIIAPSNLNLLPGKKFFYRGRFEGAEFVLLSNSGLLRRGVIGYIWHYCSSICLIIPSLYFTKKSDVCLIYMSTSLTRFLLICLLRLLGKKVVIELNEYPYAPEGSRFTQFSFVKRVLSSFVFRVIFPMSHGILVISKSLEKLAAAYAPRAKLLRVPILVEKAIGISPEHKAKPTDDLYLFHAGTLSEQKDGILAVFEAFGVAHQRLKAKHGVELKFYMTNKIAFEDVWRRIEAILAKYECQDHVEITGFCDEETLGLYLQSSLALVINKPVNIQNLNNFPTKLGDYLSSGRPVIVAASGMEINEYLEHEINSIVLAPNDVEGIAGAIVRLFESPVLCESIGKKGMETVQTHFHINKHGLRLSNFLRSL